MGTLARDPTEKTMREIRSSLDHAIATPRALTVSGLGKFSDEDLAVVVWSDASWDSLPGGGSQGGHHHRRDFDFRQGGGRTLLSVGI